MTQVTEQFVIRSESERGYWSNELGWVYDVVSATRFPSMDSYLPVSSGRDATYAPLDKAMDFEIDPPEGTRCARCGSQWPDGNPPRVVFNAGTGAEYREEACDICLTAQHLVDMPATAASQVNS